MVVVDEMTSEPHYSMLSLLVQQTMTVIVSTIEIVLVVIWITVEHAAAEQRAILLVSLAAISHSMG